ncbi:MAG TPA: type IV pilin [Candidatus Thermoplasmatota archaeon]|nr:type IV pilin [Candidatus Thermoplasmatota archaeon]
MQKRILNQNAVSAVMGVIIMVAITVAMGSVSYMYFTGMIGESKTETPVISFTPSATEKALRVAVADIDTYWENINITISNATSFTYITKTGIVNAGDTIYLQTDPIPVLRGTVTITFRYLLTNSFLASYTIENV